MEEQENLQKSSKRIYIQKINGIIGVIENGHHLNRHSICNDCSRIILQGVTQCPKFMDIVKQPIDRYSFITDGYQTFKEAVRKRTVLEQHVDFDNGIPADKILKKTIGLMSDSLVVYKCKGFIPDTRK